MRLGEFVLEQFGRIPKVGEKVQFDQLELTIEEGTPRVIQSIRIRRCSEESIEPEDTSS